MFLARQIGLLVVLSVIGVTPTAAQERPAAAGGFWQKLDKNSDGLLDPEEIPPGMKGIIQKSAEKAGLDATKPLSIEALLGGGKSTSAANTEQKPATDADPAKPAESSSTPPPDASGAAPASAAQPSAPPAKPPAKKLRRFLTAHERLPSGLPSWFVQSDHDKDAQVMMHEFTNEWSDRKAAEFASYDHNGDGVITAKEALGRPISPPPKPLSSLATTPLAQSSSESEGSTNSTSSSTTSAGNASPSSGGDSRSNSEGYRSNRNRDYGNNSDRRRNNFRPEGRRSRN